MRTMQWPIEEADLDRIVLDPRNVRVRAGRGDDFQENDRRAMDEAIVRYMVEAENVLELMNDILRDGYLDNEIPVVVPEGAGMVVLEGNRRLTALKLIDDPALLGPGAPRAERLLSRYPEHGTPTRIRTMVAPSRDAAQPLLARLHTGDSKKSWLREQQSIFFHAQLDGSTTVDDLRVAFPGQAPKMARFIAMGEMRAVIRRMKYKDPVLRDYVLNSELKMTAFEYVYRPKRLHQALGLELDRDGLLANKALSSGQQRAITYILERLRTKTLNTRSPELIAKYEEHEQFIALIEQIVAGEKQEPKPVGTNREGGSLVDSSGPLDADGKEGAKAHASTASPGDVDSSEEGPGSRGANRGETKSRLDFSGFSYAGSSGGMRRRFEELRTLDIKTYPNAAYDLLRTVLECSIKEYLRVQGAPLAPAKTLGPAVDALATKFSKNPKMIGHINSIKRNGKMSAEQYAGTAFALNATNHEPDQVVGHQEVHEGWDRLKPILIEIVGPPRSAA